MGYATTVEDGICLADEVVLPVDYVTKTAAILAQRRKGKTYTASKIAEELVRLGQPWVALDPTGAWWGLRSSADGERAGLPVVVIGGQHGDLPLDVGSGAAIADLVLDYPGWYVIDLSLLEGRPAEREFATAFGARLHRRKMQPGMDFPLHLFIDEADLFVPQEKETKADVALLAAYQGIVRRGGLHGLGVTLISQRPALVNKNALTQLDLLILLRLVAGNDQDAVYKNYLSRAADKETCALIIGSLASLPVGEGWFFEPGEDVLIRSRVDARATFNSSATPKVGETRVEPKVLADVMLDDLRARLSDAIERAEADDPDALRRKLEHERRMRAEAEADLRALAEWAREVEEADDGPTAIDALIATYTAAKSRVGYSCDLIDEARALAAGGGAKPQRISDEDGVAALDLICEAELAVMKGLDLIRSASAPIAAAGSEDVLPESEPEPEPEPAARERAKTSVDRVERSAPGIVADSLKRQQEREQAPAPVAPAAKIPGAGKGERKVLEVLAQYPEGKTLKEVAFLAGYSAKASTIGARVSNLRKLGLVEPNAPVRLTPAGFEAAGGVRSMPTGPALLDHWMKHPKMGDGERRVLRALIDAYPNVLANDELARQTGYSAEASTIGARLSNLRKLGLVEKGARRVTPAFYEAIQ